MDSMSIAVSRALKRIAWLSGIPMKEQVEKRVGKLECSDRLNDMNLLSNISKKSL